MVKQRFLFILNVEIGKDLGKVGLERGYGGRAAGVEKLDELCGLTQHDSGLMHVNTHIVAEIGES